jgi:hypothetical protein
VHAGRVLRLAQAQGAAPPLPSSTDLWVPYEGSEAILLAVVLLVVAGSFAYAGTRLRAPLKVTRPELTVTWFMIAIWLLANYAVIIVWWVYGLQVREAYPNFVAPRLHRVGTFLVDAPVTFFVILYLTRRWGWKVALASAAIGTASAPMIFEFPFDHHVGEQSADSGSSDAVSAASIRVVVPVGVYNGIAADVAAFDAGDCVRRLRGSGDVSGIGRLGSIRVRVSSGTGTARAKCHLENSVLRSGNHAVRLEG